MNEVIIDTFFLIRYLFSFHDSDKDPEYVLDDAESDTNIASDDTNIASGSPPSAQKKEMFITI